MTTEPFVGRERELERLREAFDGAREGRGGLVMITGEPGIGKTRLARELEGYAVEHGARVLWGRAHEAGGALTPTTSASARSRCCDWLLPGRRTPTSPTSW